LILPQAVLDAPKFGCLNIHASLLPRWRGAAPIHRAILAGDTQTGVCIMQMEAGLDTGPVLFRDEMPIDDNDTTALLHDKLSAQGAALIVRALDQLPDLVAQPQPDDGVTYAHKIDKAEAQIDWTRPAVDIDRQIRGLSPFPGAWFECQGARVKCLASCVVDGNGSAGQILSQTGELIIACGQGAVRITRAQRAGKSAQDIVDFLRGFQLGDGPLV